MPNVSNGDIYSTEFVDLTGWTDQDSLSGAGTAVTFDSKTCLKLITGTTSGAGAQQYKNFGVFGATRVVISLSLYCDIVGNHTGVQWPQFYFSGATKVCTMKFASDGMYTYNGVTFTEQGTDLVVIQTWQEWTFDINFTTGRADIYLDQVLKASNVDVGYNAGFAANGDVYLTIYNDSATNLICYVDWIKAGSAFASGSSSSTVTPGSALSRIITNQPTVSFNRSSLVNVGSARNRILVYSPLTPAMPPMGGVDLLVNSKIQKSLVINSQINKSSYSSSRIDKFVNQRSLIDKNLLAQSSIKD